jgi:phosphoribosyl-ATP pyrophosphohydrolase
MILETIDQTLLARKQQLDDCLKNHPEKIDHLKSSYVIKLYQKGDELICKKIAEEAAEVIMANKDLSLNQHNHENIDQNQQHLICEVADLWFHTMVLLQHHGLNSHMVLAELAKREGISGIAEKASRPNLV